jgi:transcriptional regulator with XRE-family HTH domain
LDGLSFGQRIVAYRSKKGMLQKELAGNAGLSPTQLNYYEKDKREPNIASIKALAQALGITGDELLGRSTAKSPTQAQTADEIQLLNNYRALNKDGREYLCQTMELITTNEKYTKDTPVPGMEVEPYITERPAPAFTLPRSAAVPYAGDMETSRELTEEEAVALVHARYEAGKKDNTSSSTSERQAQ